MKYEDTPVKCRTCRHFYMYRDMDGQAMFSCRENSCNMKGDECGERVDIYGDDHNLTENTPKPGSFSLCSFIAMPVRFILDWFFD